MKHQLILGTAIGLLCSVALSAQPGDTCGHVAHVDSPFLSEEGEHIHYCRQGDLAIAEGDIILPPQTAGERNADGTASYAGVISRSSGLWDDGEIPYVVSSSLPNQQRVWSAIHQWQNRTSLRFVRRTNQRDYIIFAPGSGCSSSIGRVGGAQYIYLAQGCDTAAVTHEIGHAVGLWHEQSRNDRDSFIDIIWSNIAQKHRFNFNKFQSAGRTHGDYDYESIMHYASYAFSSNGRPTIVIKGTGKTLSSSRDRLSDGDVAAVEYLYR